MTRARRKGRIGFGADNDGRFLDGRNQEGVRHAQLHQQLVQQLDLKKLHVEIRSRGIPRPLALDAVRHAGALWEERLALLAQESAEGWEACHAQALWIHANVPPPLVNDMGRQYSVEKLKMDLSKGLSDENPYTGHGVLAGYKSEFVMKFFEQPFPRRGYRNFVEAGPPSFDAINGPPFDDIVADVILALREQGREAHLEVARDREISWQADIGRGRLKCGMRFNHASTRQPIRHRPPACSRESAIRR